MDVTVEVTDDQRSATFWVRRFVLEGMALGRTSDKEALVVAGMIGTSIDPEELREAPSVSAALELLAINTSNVCCARLCLVRQRSLDLDCCCRTFGKVVASKALQLDTLLAPCLQHVACVAGELAVAAQLSCVSKALRATLQVHAKHGVAGELGLAVPIWTKPGPGSAAPTVVRWDARSGTLTKTARPGHALVVFADRLCSVSAIVQFEVTSLESIGGIELGVVAAESDSFGVAARTWA